MYIHQVALCNAFGKVLIFRMQLQTVWIMKSKKADTSWWLVL